MFKLYGSLILCEYVSNPWKNSKIHNSGTMKGKQETLIIIQLRKKYLSMSWKGMNEEAGLC